jgi:hypothetical protein
MKIDDEAREACDAMSAMQWPRLLQRCGPGLEGWARDNGRGMSDYAEPLSQGVRHESETMPHLMCLRRSGAEIMTLFPEPFDVVSLSVCSLPH